MSEYVTDVEHLNETLMRIQREGVERVVRIREGAGAARTVIAELLDEPPLEIR